MTKNKIIIAGNNNAGLCYFRLAMFEEALECFDNTLKLDPENKEALNNKGLLFFEKNEYRTAIYWYDQVTPKDSMVFTNKGMVYNELRKFEIAIKCFDEALEIDPGYTDTYAHKSFSLYSLGRYEEVISLSELFLEVSPLHLEISNKQATMYFHLAVAHARLAKTDKEYKKALKYYNRYLIIIPHDSVALRAKADLLNTLGYFESALDTYDECLRYNDNPYDSEILSNQAGIFMKLNKSIKAILYSHFTIKINPRHMGAYYNFGEFLFKNGDLSSAMEIFTKSANLQLADYYEEHSFNKIKYFDDLKYQGLGLMRIKKYSDALERFEKVLVHLPDNVDILELVGETLEKLEKFNDAISIYDQILHINPENKFALAHKGESLAHMNKDKDAIGVYNKFLKIHPNDSTVLTNKAVALSNMGTTKRALKLFDKALEIDPINEITLYGKGQTLNRLGKFEEALEALDEAIEIDRKFYGTYIEIGNSLNKLHQPENAIKSYLEALRLNSQYPQTLLNLSNTYNLIGDTTNGRKYLEKYLKLEKELSNFYFPGEGYPVFKNRDE